MMSEGRETENNNPKTENKTKNDALELETLIRRPSLRKNIRKRSSQVYREMELTPETTCGFGYCKGSWLQSLANKKAYVLIYGVLGCIYGAYYAYCTGIITTMEKRFKIPSRVMGFVSAGSDLSSIFASPILSYYTGKGHRPRWMGFGIYTAVLSCITLSSIHFVYGPGEDALQFTKEFGDDDILNRTRDVFLRTQASKLLCSETPAKCTTEKAEGTMPVALLLFTQLIHGVGGSLYYTLGTAYMDDNIKKSKTPVLISFSYILKMLGPAFGYWLSSMCLKVFVSPTLTPTINEEDPRWIGAWWIGSLVLGFLLFVIATMIMMFPKTLPRAAARKAIADNRRLGEKRKSISGQANFSDMIATFKRLLRNPTYNCNNFAGVFYLLGLMAYWTFLPKYIETQYRVSASTANFVTGTVTLVFSSIGILLAALIITKFRPRARWLAGWNVIVGVLSCIGISSYVLFGCSGSEPQTSMVLASNGSSLCSPICRCDHTPYSPICSETQQTFISACHAGCRNTSILNGTKVFTDCECIPLSINGTSSWGSAIEGSCPLDCHSAFLGFVAVVCFVNFIGASGRTSNFLVQLRCVDERDKSVSLGVGITFLCSFAFLPAPILFGYIMDTTCLFWGKTCEGYGNCWLYDKQHLRYVMNFTATAFVALGTMFDIGVWYFVKNLKIFDDEVVEKEEEADD